jgi:hypothetical protein
MGARNETQDRSQARVERLTFPLSLSPEPNMDHTRTTDLSCAVSAIQRGVRHVLTFALVAHLFSFTASLSGGERTERNWYGGTWDSSIRNLVDHPRTVAVRIKVVDAETRLPVSDAHVRFRGTFLTAARTSRHPEGEQQAREREYELSTKTRKDGVVVAAFRWQKEFPSKRSGEVDDIEKAQRVEIRHPQYRFVDQRLPFVRLLEIGQNRGSGTPRTTVISSFGRAWKAEGVRKDVKYCILDLGTEFSDFENKGCTRPEFFQTIRDKKWAKLYDKPRNWFSKGEYPQSLCGPYFIYVIEVRLHRSASKLNVHVRDRH